MKETTQQRKQRTVHFCTVCPLWATLRVTVSRTVSLYTSLAILSLDPRFADIPMLAIFPDLR